MKFPKISLKFTERKNFFKKNEKLFSNLNKLAIVNLYVITVFAILFFATDLIFNLQKQKEQNFRETELKTQIKVWENIADKYKGYKDAYYQLAVLEYNLGDLEKSKVYLDKTLYLDPNFGEAKDLQKVLKNY